MPKIWRLAKAEELFQIQQRAIARMEMALKRYQLWVQVSDKFASRVRSMQTRLEKVEKLDRPELERRKMGLELNGWLAPQPASGAGIPV